MKTSPALALLLSQLFGVSFALRPDAYYDKRGVSQQDQLYGRDINEDAMFARDAEAEAYGDDNGEDFSQLTARDILEAALAEIRARDLPLDTASLYGRSHPGSAAGGAGGAGAGAEMGGGGAGGLESGAGGGAGAGGYGAEGGAGGAMDPSMGGGAGGAGGGAGSEMEKLMGGGAGGASPYGAHFGGKKHKHKHHKSKYGSMKTGGGMHGMMGHESLMGGASGGAGAMGGALGAGSGAGAGMGAGMARRDAEAEAEAEAYPDAEADPYAWDMMEGY